MQDSPQLEKFIIDQHRIGDPVIVAYCTGGKSRYVRGRIYSVKEYIEVSFLHSDGDSTSTLLFNRTGNLYDAPCSTAIYKAQLYRASEQTLTAIRWEQAAQTCNDSPAPAVVPLNMIDYKDMTDSVEDILALIMGA